MLSSSQLLVLLQHMGVIVLQQPHILQDSLHRLLGSISSGILVGGKLSCVINFRFPLALVATYCLFKDPDSSCLEVAV